MPIFQDASDSVSTLIDQINQTFGVPPSAPPAPSSPPTGGGAPPALPGGPLVSSTPSPGQGIALDVAGKVPQSTRLSIAGAELAVTEFSSNATISATTEATANTIVTAAAVRFDGASKVEVQFFTPLIQASKNAAGNFCALVLYEDGASIGLLCDVGSADNTQVEASQRVSRFLTPTLGFHTYSVRGYRNTANCTVFGGAGGSGAFMPGYVRIVRV